jgi:hypothetical protein
VAGFTRRPDSHSSGRQDKGLIPRSCASCPLRPGFNHLARHHEGQIARARGEPWMRRAFAMEPDLWRVSWDRAAVERTSISSLVRERSTRLWRLPDPGPRAVPPRKQSVASRLSRTPSSRAVRFRPRCGRGALVDGRGLHTFEVPQSHRASSESGSPDATIRTRVQCQMDSGCPPNGCSIPIHRAYCDPGHGIAGDLLTVCTLIR